MIKQIDHLAIVVIDLEKNRKFFEILGFEETIRSSLASGPGKKQGSASFISMVPMESLWNSHSIRKKISRLLPFLLARRKVTERMAPGGNP